MIRNTLAAGLALLLTTPCPATIMSVTHFSVDLTKPQDAKAEATWSEPDKIGVTAQGLGWGSFADTGSRDVWLQTTEPIGLGVSWRPTIATYLRVTIRGPGNNGQLYARYSADATHWTTWQPLEAEPMPPGVAGTAKGPTQSFKGLLRVPYREHGKYGELVSAYSRRQEVPWASDEEAAVKEIVKTDAKFFERQTPFIGYVQLLYETQLPGGQRVQGMDVQAEWAVGGMHAIPRDPAAQKDRDGPWRFRAGR
jgi:hypothetical protein